MRTIILASKDDPTARALYNRIRSRVKIDRVVLEDKEPLGLFLKRRLKRLGLLKVASQVLFKAVAVPVLTKRTSQRVRKLKRHYSLDESPIPSELVHACTSVNEPAIVNLIRERRPELVVINGTRILSRDLLASISCPVLNTHAGITPLYRGVHGGYWACVQNDRAHCGVTVHLVDPGIDTGGILYQSTIPAKDDDNYLTYPVHQQAAGLELLEKAIEDARNGSLRTKSPPQGASKLWYHPGLFEYLVNGLSKGVW
jgi:methionyl-tRNA formyltransferase